jgi:hypothetical protein
MTPCWTKAEPFDQQIEQKKWPALQNVIAVRFFLLARPPLVLVGY